MLQEGLSYPTKGEEWIGRTTIGGLLAYFSVLLVPLLPYYGYQVKVLSSTADGERTPPDFEGWLSLTLDGIEASVVAVLYLVLPNLVLGTVVFVLLLAIGGLGTADVADPEAVAGVGFVTLAVLGVVVAAVEFAILYLFPSALVNFAAEGSIRSAVSPRSVLGLAVSWQYLLAMLLPIVVGFVVVVLSSTIVGTVLAPAFVFWGSIAVTRMFGIAYREVHGIPVESPVPAGAGAPTPAGAGRPGQGRTVAEPESVPATEPDPGPGREPTTGPAGESGSEPEPAGAPGPESDDDSEPAPAGEPEPGGDPEPDPDPDGTADPGSERASRAESAGGTDGTAGSADEVEPADGSSRDAEEPSGVEDPAGGGSTPEDDLDDRGEVEDSPEVDARDESTATEGPEDGETPTPGDAAGTDDAGETFRFGGDGGSGDPDDLGGPEAPRTGETGGSDDAIFGEAGSEDADDIFDEVGGEDTGEPDDAIFGEAGSEDADDGDRSEDATGVDGDEERDSAGSVEPNGDEERRPERGEEAETGEGPDDDDPDGGSSRS